MCRWKSNRQQVYAWCPGIRPACCVAIALVWWFAAGCDSRPNAEQSSSLQPSEDGPITVYDLDGQPVHPLADQHARAIVFVFLRADCPISNRYAPELRRLQEKFAPLGVRFWLVYSDPALKPAAIRKHAEEFQLPMSILRDPVHWLVRRGRVRVTPEVAVFVAHGDLVYHGRIDNRFVDFGLERPDPTERDLEQVLESVLAGRPIKNRSRPAVGCYIAEP